MQRVAVRNLLGIITWLNVLHGHPWRKTPELSSEIQTHLCSARKLILYRGLCQKLHSWMLSRQYHFNHMNKPSFQPSRQSSGLRSTGSWWCNSIPYLKRPHNLASKTLKHMLNLMGWFIHSFQWCNIWQKPSRWFWVLLDGGLDA